LRYILVFSYFLVFLVVDLVVRRLVPAVTHIPSCGRIVWCPPLAGVSLFPEPVEGQGRGWALASTGENPPPCPPPAGDILDIKKPYRNKIADTVFKGLRILQFIDSELYGGGKRHNISCLWFCSGVLVVQRYEI